MSQSRPPRATFAVLAAIVRPIMNGLMGRKWFGTGNLPKDRGFIVCPNHVTEIDPVVVGHFLYSNKVLPHFLAKASLFRVPVLGQMLHGLQQIPVERSTAGANRSLETARGILGQGGGIIIYPEGTLTRDPGLWPMKGRTGAARLALQTGAPVIPVAQWGAQEVLPRYAKRLRIFPRRTVRVLAGEPVDLSEFAGRPLDKATLSAATDRILDAVTALLAELRGEEPPAERWDPVAHNQTTLGRMMEKNPPALGADNGNGAGEGKA
jgi:1-acyl-sn-glycerol-3-phosphate acyltransferase